MWSYYGAKTVLIDHYPPPKHGKIIEPFSGTAQYALKYFDKDIILVDKYDVIIKIWKWLQKCSPSDIDNLPHHLTEEHNLNDIVFDCDEAKMLMGFIIAKGAHRPRYKPSHRATTQRPNYINHKLNEIKNNLWKIKHWEIKHGSYDELKNETATWFIDPPYEFGGHAYVENEIDFIKLAEWCKSRNGQTIVCENTKANWLPFKPMIVNNGSSGKTIEAIWSNEPTVFDNVQQELF